MARLSLSKTSTRRSLCQGPVRGTVSLPRLSPLSFGPAVMAPRPRNLPRPPRGRQLEKRTREDGRQKSVLPHMSSVVRLAPGYAHVAGQRRPLMASVDDEIVPLGLARDRFRNRRIEQIVAFGRAQRRAQIGGVLLTEAHVEGSRAGHPHPIAGFAEIVGQRRDEAEPAAGL